MALTVTEASLAFEPAMRNVQAVGAGICSICHQLIDPAYSTCYSCNRQPDMLDAVVPITYSEHLGQMHTALRTYKEGPPETRRYVAVRLTAILWRFSNRHESCAAKAAGVDAFDVVTAVPSTSPDRDAQGHLRQIVERCDPLKERHRRLLVPTGEVPADERHYAPERYRAEQRIEGERVLLVDDTWTTGGHAQSAAAALMDAGASNVVLVVLGRHFHRDYELGDETAGDRFDTLPRPFDWNTCCVHEP